MFSPTDKRNFASESDFYPLGFPNVRRPNRELEVLVRYRVMVSV